MQEELAVVYEMLGLEEDALVNFDELDALFSQFIINAGAGGKIRLLTKIVYKSTLPHFQGIHSNVLPPEVPEPCWTVDTKIVNYSVRSCVNNFDVGFRSQLCSFLLSRAEGIQLVLLYSDSFCNLQASNSLLSSNSLMSSNSLLSVDLSLSKNDAVT
jgi:hypothetical protein